MSIFTSTEILARQRVLMERTGSINCAVLFSFFNSYYMSGVPIIPWGRPTITIVPSRGSPAMIVSALEVTRVREHSPIAELHTYSDRDGPNEVVAVELLGKLLASRGLRRIGLDGTGTPSAMVEQLEKAHTDLELHDISPIIDEMKLTSSDEELKLIRAGTEIADVGIRTFIDEARVGTPEVVLAGRAMLAMSEYAAARFEESEFKVNCYSQQGVRSLQPHTGASGEPLKSGQLMALVIEVYVWSYQVAVERALIVGKPNEAQSHYYKTMIEAQDRALAAIRPGATFSEVDIASSTVFEENGYEPPDCGCGLIRGLLTEWAGRIDGGNLRAYNDRKLAPNMVLSVEPWAIAPGVGAPRHCDVVLVTKDGYELISKRPTEMIVVGN